MPHRKLKDSQNYFIHALFHILKDIRDVKHSTSVSRWLDPDAKAFADIRNAIEHRSLKIVDDFGYTLTQSDKDFMQSQLEVLYRDRDNFGVKLQALNSEIDLTKNTNNNALKVELGTKKRELEENLHDVKSQILEKKNFLAILYSSKKVNLNQGL